MLTLISCIVISLNFKLQGRASALLKHDYSLVSLIEYRFGDTEDFSSGKLYLDIINKDVELEMLEGSIKDLINSGDYEYRNCRTISHLTTVGKRLIVMRDCDCFFNENEKFMANPELESVPLMIFCVEETNSDILALQMRHVKNLIFTDMDLCKLLKDGGEFKLLNLKREFNYDGLFAILIPILVIGFFIVASFTLYFCLN